MHVFYMSWMEPMLSRYAAVHRDWVDLLVFPWRPITSERWLIAGFGVVYTSACALVMSTYHEVLDVSSTIHSFALILLWCKVGPVGMPLSVRRSRL